MADEGFLDEGDAGLALGHPPPPQPGIIGDGDAHQNNNNDNLQFDIIPLDVANNLNMAPDVIMAEDDDLPDYYDDMRNNNEAFGGDIEMHVGDGPFVIMDYPDNSRDRIHGPPVPHVGDMWQPAAREEVLRPPEEMNFTVDSVNLDLDTHVGSHTGLIKIMRLQHVARHCPQLRVDALKMVLKCALDTLDTGLYTRTQAELKNAVDAGLKSEEGDLGLPKVDENWLRDTKKTFEGRMDRLEGDLKNYKSNGIKESVWRAYEDIGGHFLMAGNASDALKSYNKARDYCESTRESAQTLANRLKTCVYLRYFPNINQMIDQMRGDYDSLAERRDSKKDGDKAMTVDKRQETALNLMRACVGIYYLSIREYEKAADIFVALNPEYCEFPNVIAGRDIALYGAICAVATYDRTKLKARVINNKTFKSFLETAPEIRRLVEAFHNSKFRDYLQSFTSQKNILMLDIFLAPHVDTLFNQVRLHGMVEYFRCYASVSLVEMAQEFCWDSTTLLQEQLMKMILANQLPARIDSINQVLNKDKPDVFLEAAGKMQVESEHLRRSLRLALVRSSMVRAGHYVRGARMDELGSSSI